MNMFTVEVPLAEQPAGTKEVLVKERKVNALYYMYQDKYTFWYKLVAKQNVQIDFIVSPSNRTDRYQVVVYRHSGPDFCDKLVNSGLEPIQAERAPIFMPGDKLVYRYTLRAKKGDVYQVAVLALNAEDCGHFMRIQAGAEPISIHAVHKPCYNFETLAIPDFSMAKQQATNVKLFLAQYSDTPKVKPQPAKTTEPQVPTPVLKEGYGSLISIEIQSAEDDMVSVGDRLVLNNVFFYNNTYAIKPESTDELSQLIDFLKANPQVNIEIQGYTNNNNDDIRPDAAFKNQGAAWNFKGTALKLSEMRALAVRDHLIKAGISKKRLSAVGMGDVNKRVPNATTFEDSEKNMRVEVLVVQ
jgi:outer membrane protein OmpA-like peptidoglycan-associated protein